MCPSIDPERMDEFYTHSVFKSLSITGRRPVNMKITCKIWGFHGSDYEECRILGRCAV
jgi:hypothetical protein